MIDIAVSFIEIKIRNDYMRTSMSYDVKLSLYDYATRTPLGVILTKDARFFLLQKF